MEKQLAQLESTVNSRPQGGLPGTTYPNPKQVNVVSTRSRRSLTKLVPKKKDGAQPSTAQTDEDCNPRPTTDKETPLPKPPPLFHIEFEKEKG